MASAASDPGGPVFHPSLGRELSPPYSAGLYSGVVAAAPAAPLHSPAAALGATPPPLLRPSRELGAGRSAPAPLLAGQSAPPPLSAASAAVASLPPAQQQPGGRGPASLSGFGDVVAALDDIHARLQARLQERTSPPARPPPQRAPWGAHPSAGPPDSAGLGDAASQIDALGELTRGMEAGRSPPVSFPAPRPAGAALSPPPARAPGVPVASISTVPEPPQLQMQQQQQQQQLRLERDQFGRLQLSCSTAAQAAPEPEEELPPFYPGQRVAASRNLTVLQDSGLVVAVPEGSEGIVLGPAPLHQDRVSVDFACCPDHALNVRAEEVAHAGDPFDEASLSVEAHLARLLWEGRDRGANSGEPSGIDPLHQRRLMRFFERYNPHRLASVAALLREHAGGEEEFFAALVRRYGPEPEEKPVLLPPGWQLVRSPQGDMYYRHANGQRQWHCPPYNPVSPS
eukprot:TRINITY_DN3512_c0_g1_i1.p1 TRINITY_DN3512_c0_g1~~TRINITY_DN3512_c0_g1_i1.p1  ORF type:complete len:456 (+),score=129.81 TRINITY_DN3512_c0_g1_i1:119-1486(+)